MTEEVQHVYLREDKAIPGQNYVCLSFISPEKTINMKNDYFAYKYQQHVAGEYVNIFNELVDKILDGDEVEMSQVVDLKKRMTRVAGEVLVDYDKHKSLYADYLFREEEVIGKEFDKSNNFQTSVRGVKIRGVYDTLEEAQTRGAVLQKIDPVHNILLGKVGAWVPFDPDVAKMNNVKYLDDNLNELMKANDENQKKKDHFFKEQTRQRIQESKEQQERLRKQIEAEKDEVATTTQEDEEVETIQADALDNVDPWMSRKTEQ